MSDSMEELLKEHKKSLDEFYEKGETHGYIMCFIQMQLHLASYLTDNKYKSADSILEYILGLNVDDIVYTKQKQKPSMPIDKPEVYERPEI